MAERHGNSVSLRSANVTQASGTSGNGVTTSAPRQWRETRTGMPEGTGYRYGGADEAREAEVAGRVAAARAEALRRAGLDGAEVTLW